MKYSLQEALRELNNPKKNLKESNEDIVTAVFKDNGFDKQEFEEAYPELMSKLEFDTRKFDNRENQLAYCDIYVKGKREDVEEFIQKSIWDYGCDTKEEAEELYGEGCIPTVIDESLKEDTKKFEDKDAEEEYFRHIQELSTDYEDPDAEEYEEDDYDEEDVELEEAYDSIITLYVYDKDGNELTRIGSDPKEALDYLKNNKEASRVTYTNTSGGDEYDYAFKNKDGKIKLHTFINSKDEYDYTEESLNEDAKFVTAATILKKEQAAIFAQPTEEGMRKMVLDILNKNKDKMKPENYNAVVKTMTNCPKRAVPSTVWTMLNPSQKVGK